MPLQETRRAEAHRRLKPAPLIGAAQQPGRIFEAATGSAIGGGQSLLIFQRWIGSVGEEQLDDRRCARLVIRQPEYRSLALVVLRTALESSQLRP